MGQESYWSLQRKRTINVDALKEHFENDVKIFYSHSLDGCEDTFFEEGKWLGKKEYEKFDMRDVMLFFSERQRSFQIELLHFLAEYKIHTDTQIEIAHEFMRVNIFDKLGISMDGEWRNRSWVEAETWTGTSFPYNFNEFDGEVQ